MTGDPWLRLAPSAQPPKARVFFMPYAGAGIGQFLSWRRYVPPWVQVGGLQLPGREERAGETFCPDLATVCRHGVESLAPVLDLPYSIFAHSLGATLAIEIVNRLYSEGLPLPKRVILSGANPPHRMKRYDLNAFSDHDLLAQAQIWSGSMLGQLPAEIQAHFLQILRADIRMLDLYECRLSKLPQWKSRRMVVLPIPLSASNRCKTGNTGGAISWYNYTRVAIFSFGPEKVRCANC